MSAVNPDLVEQRLAERVSAAVGQLRADAATNTSASDEAGAAVPGDTPTQSSDPIELLDQLLRSHAPNGRTTWLLLVAMSTVFPTQPKVSQVRRALELAPAAERVELLMDVSLELLRERGNPLSTLHIVTDEWVVDCNHSARFDSNTGIQRVVRNTVSRWITSGRPVVPACWTDTDGSYRTLEARELARLLHWDEPQRWPSKGRSPHTVVVPWGTTLVLPEVPEAWQCDVLTALVRNTDNRVVAIGHDCIPVVSSDMLPQREPNKFVHYLSLIKHIDRISTVSRSAAIEFGGYSSCLPAQGLAGPEVVACPLPIEVPKWATASPVKRAQPAMITCIGSHEPRKNHMTVLFAAETLWREGLEFSIRFIGGKGWDDQGFERWATQLAAQGRAVSLEHGVRDPDLWRAYRESRFTMFPSLHEGYGLPVAESIALGTPVITSDHGSMAEIAEGGGALLVDSRNDEAMAAAMRSLLTDDTLCAQLTTQAESRRRPTWDEYAENVWAAFHAESAPDREEAQ